MSIVNWWVLSNDLLSLIIDFILLFFWRKHEANKLAVDVKLKIYPNCLPTSFLLFFLLREIKAEISWLQILSCHPSLHEIRVRARNGAALVCYCSQSGFFIVHRHSTVYLYDQKEFIWAILSLEMVLVGCETHFTMYFLCVVRKRVNKTIRLFHILQDSWNFMEFQALSSDLP